MLQFIFNLYSIYLLKAIQHQQLLSEIVSFRTLHWFIHLSSRTRNTASNDPLEGDPEVQVEHGVYDGVQGGVDVAEPGYELSHLHVW